ncbi:MAG: zf-HC2 domain-containing protein [Burkholderiales bacterium]
MRLITCKEVSMLASQQHERKLTPWERFTLRIHLFVCDGCRRVVRQMAFIRRAVKRLAESAGRDEASR